jgi:hypothetical protein
MRMAVVQLSNGEVINVIIAEPIDPPPDGCELIGLPDDSTVSIGWYWDGTEFYNPAPPPDDPPL